MKTANMKNSMKALNEALSVRSWFQSNFILEVLDN